MPIHWEDFDPTGRKNPPVPEVRAEVEATAADLLGLPADMAAEVWGTAIGYGCSSVAVIRVAEGVPHRFRSRAPDVVVKVFRTAAWKSLRFQQDHIVGRDLARVQRSLAAAIRPSRGGRSRGYVVLEYISGSSLEQYLRAGPYPGKLVRSWIRQSLAEIVVPLWAEGHRFWDVRPCNLVVAPDGNRLTLIDNDLFRLGTIERDCQPEDWSWRNHLEGIALGRGGDRPHPGMLPRLVVQLLRVQGRHSGSHISRGVREAWQAAGVTRALSALGRGGCEGTTASCAAIEGLLDRLSVAGLLASASCDES